MTIQNNTDIILMGKRKTPIPLFTGSDLPTFLLLISYVGGITYPVTDRVFMNGNNL